MPFPHFIIFFLKQTPMLYSSDWFSITDCTKPSLDDFLPQGIAYAYTLSGHSQHLYPGNFPYPRLQFIMESKHQSIKALLKTMDQNFGAESVSLSREIASTLFYPYLEQIITPNFKVKGSAYSNKAKEIVDRVAELQLTYKINYQMNSGMKDDAIMEPYRDILLFFLRTNILFIHIIYIFFQTIMFFE